MKNDTSQVLTWEWSLLMMKPLLKSSTNQTNLFQVLLQQQILLQVLSGADLNDVYAVYLSTTWWRFLVVVVVVVVVILWMFGIIYRSSLNSNRFKRWTFQAGISFTKNCIIYIRPCPSLFVAGRFYFCNSSATKRFLSTVQRFCSLSSQWAHLLPHSSLLCWQASWQRYTIR